ncbi:hypothetical protein JQ557_12790 [Bradyrhizobium sp. U87765 SZCCT0131]|uniref:hypothetical protein n=1 Tax=unclassified Bradyrhizobium TaxID=2631580 RepID=UPI001BAD8170|nr:MULTISPECIES: hypothetical protein [unclassified Bradyrhizobium]MBR1218872.1 hypothetical protein [Bradyrhizobium sp. U87765 SZCCT0131]MBR1261523.1 hypothetical protein [Bradyrhizobium sp. U87765 SZCCT0134]MBR1306624.1 hypothetical protein [Bradyrhizobium sp. U87765 SZCCT0110]MBR1317305.1 hypothetical protein [Bradyrhizobium sp. U87765 SZCCT0109]MBR1351007.1 hypothetical protein [Bradyrhizobium sp. U87765 SZCCT0048]
MAGIITFAKDCRDTADAALTRALRSDTVAACVGWTMIAGLGSVGAALQHVLQSHIL